MTGIDDRKMMVLIFIIVIDLSLNGNTLKIEE
jgi:hypothetical protein